MTDEDRDRAQAEEHVHEDIELGDDEAAGVKGGAAYKERADGSLDAGLHFKYDIKGNKEG